MSGFAPSVEAAQRALGAGAKIVATPHPGGVKGIKFSLEEVARRAWRARNDPRLVAWAGRALMHRVGCPYVKSQKNACVCGGMDRPKGVAAQTQKLLEQFRAQTIYTQDGVGTERMSQPVETLCLDENGLCMPARDCFPSGTILLRDDYTLVPVEQIRVGDRIWGLDRWTTVKNVWFKGQLVLDTIVLNNGSHVPLTRDHHVFVARCYGPHHPYRTDAEKGCFCPVEKRRLERVSLGDLCVHDVLLQPVRIPFGSQEMDPDRAYVEGLYASEGWINSEREFCISGCDGFRKEAQKHEVKAICDKLGIATRWHRKSIVIKNREWTQEMARLGGRARFKCVASIAFQETSLAELLRGVMADSTANTNGEGRTFSTTSNTLMVQTRVMHRMFGRSTGVRYMTPEQHGGAGKHGMWRMQIRAPGVKHDKMLRVREIERGTGKAECWDITTEDGFVYLPAHDVTVSNCDDGVVALTGATLGIGIGSCIIGQAFDASGIPVHVISGVYDPERGLLRADPSDDKWPVGQSAPGVTSEKIVKLNENPSVNLSGSNDSGDFIGIGAIQSVSRALGQIDPNPPEQGGLTNDGNQCPPGSYYDPTSGVCIGAVASGSGSSGFAPGQQVTGPVPIQPLPAGNWDAVPDFGIQTGLRYVIGALFPPSHDTAPMQIPTPWGLVTIPGDSAPWTEQDVRTVFQGDFTIEKVWPGNVSNSWLLQGIAQRTMSPYAGNVRKTDQGQPVVNVLEVFREHVAAPGPGPGIPGVSSKWMPWVLGAAALAAAAGAAYWYKTAHATSAPAFPAYAPHGRRRNPAPAESFTYRGVRVNVYQTMHGWEACFGTVKGDSGECWPGASRDLALRKAIDRLNRRIDHER